jgi:hypothetical protein
VTPAAEKSVFPTLLDFPAPHIRSYPVYTVVAEKFEAMVKLGITNSRMKDFFDLWVLANHSNFEGALLVIAVTATFERRRTAIPQGVPIGLSDEFFTDSQKEKQWQGFLRKNALARLSLEKVISDLREFLLPVLATISTDGRLDRTWHAKNGWQ